MRHVARARDPDPSWILAGRARSTDLGHSWLTGPSNLSLVHVGRESARDRRGMAPQRRLDTAAAEFVANARSTTSWRTPIESSSTIGSPDIVI